jgi:hypothetical protein
VETTVGRALLAEIRPAGMPFRLLNHQFLLPPSWIEKDCGFC